MPPGCRLHGVGSGSLNGRCGACPEDIFQIFRTLGTRTRSPSASRALARRRSAPCRDCWVRAPDGRPGCGAWRLLGSRRPGCEAPRARKGRGDRPGPMAGHRRGRWAQREAAGPEQWRARGPFRGHKLGKVDSQPPKFLNIFFQLPTASLFFPLFLTIYTLRTA